MTYPYTDVRDVGVVPPGTNAWVVECCHGHCPHVEPYDGSLPLAVTTRVELRPLTDGKLVGQCQDCGTVFSARVRKEPPCVASA